MRTDLLEEALSERTQAVLLAHSLGNPFNFARIERFCRDHDLWLIKGNCDALSSTYATAAATAHGPRTQQYDYVRDADADADA